MDEASIRRLWKTVVPGDLEDGDAGTTYKPAFASSILEGEAAFAPTVFTPSPDDETGTTVLQVGPELPSSEQPTVAGEQGFHEQRTLSGEPDEAAGASPSPTASQLVRAADPNAYHLMEELGRGGMGVVFRARQRTLDRDVAVKQMHETDGKKSKGGGGDRALAARRRTFISEALITGRLAHPNIVTVHDLGEGDDGAVRLAMELVGGLPWDALLHPKSDAARERAGKLDLEDHIRILVAVCNAVAFAHGHGYTHNDLKPENVMVGELGEVLVMDWGLALDVRDLGPEELRALRTLHKTNIKSPCGTPLYMPPELAAGRGASIGPWTDVYLLGATLHELITGQPPHYGTRGGVLEALASAIKSEPPELPASVPRELGDICRRALARDPDDRFASVVELRDALDAFLEHRESIVIAQRAMETLTRCAALVVETQGAGSEGDGRESAHARLYAEFAEAVAGFHQALVLWPGNVDARNAEQQARLAFAETALGHGDLGLAEAQAQSLDDELPWKTELLARIGAAKEARDRVEREVAEARAAEERLRRETEEALAAANRNLAHVFIEKADRLWEQQEVLAAQVLLAKAVSLDDDATVRERLLHAQRRGARLAWVSPSRPATTVVATSPTDRRAATGGADGVVRIWDLDTGVQVAALRGHEEEITALEVSPDGGYLASAAADRTVRLWSLAHGSEERAVLYGHDDRVTAVAFGLRDAPSFAGPDAGDESERRLAAGPWLASGSADGAVALWQLGSTRPSILVREHDASVTGLAALPDGSLASAGEDGTIRLWDVGRGIVARTLPGHGGGRVFGLSASADGRWLGSCGADGTARVWDLGSDLEVTRFDGHEDGAVHAIAFSPDGTLVASGGEDRVTRTWRAESGEEVAVLRGHRGPVIGIAWRSDGRRIVTADEEARLRVFSAKGGRTRRTPRGHAASVRHVAFSPDGALLASAGDDEAVRIWDTATGGVAGTHFGHDGAVRRVAFAPGGELIATAGEDGTVRFWHASASAESSGVAGRIRHGEGEAFSVVFSANGAEVATSGADGHVRVWERASRRVLRDVALAPGAGRALAWSPDGRSIAASDGDDVILVDLTVDEHSDDDPDGGRRVLRGHEGRVRELAFDAIGTRLASASSDGTARVWRVADGEESLVLSGHPRGVRGVAWTADGRRLVTGSTDRTVRLWDARTGACLQRLRGHEEGVTAVAVSPDGRHVASASADRTVRLWDVETWYEVLTLRAHEATVRGVAFAGDGERLASASADGSIRVSSVDNGKQLLALRGHTGGVSAVAFSPDDSLLASGSIDGTIRLWNLRRRAVAALPGKGGAIRSVAFSPKGRYLAAGCGDGTVALRDGKSGEPLRTFRGHEASVQMVAFRPNGRILVSASRDGTICFWQTDSETPIRVLRDHRDAVWDVSFSPTGDRLASASADGTLKVWDVEFGKPIATIPVEGGLACVAWSHDGRRLAAGSNDRVIRLIDVASRTTVATLTGHEGSVRRLAWSADGAFLASASADATVRLWDVERAGGAGEASRRTDTDLYERMILEGPPGSLLPSVEQMTGFRVVGLDAVPIPQNRLLEP